LNQAKTYQAETRTQGRDMTNARVKYQLIARVLDDQDPGEVAERDAR
jgi:hypothetical protein